MKTIIVQVPLDWQDQYRTALPLIDDLQNKTFSDKAELVSFLNETLERDAAAENLLWESFEDFCNAINFDELNTEDYYYAAVKLEN